MAKSSNGKRRRTTTANNKPNAKPRTAISKEPGVNLATKNANFKADQDDNYCGYVDTMLGPAKAIPENTVMLIVLGLGPQLRGYDETEFALPWQHDQIQEMAQEVANNGWVLPTFNYTQNPVMKSCVNKIKAAWAAREKNKISTKNLNEHYVKEIHKLFKQPWDRVQTKLSQTLQFFYYVWLLHPGLTREEAYNRALQYMKTVKSGKARQRFFPTLIKQKKECAAVNEVVKLEDELEQVKPDVFQFKDPVAACETMRKALAVMGRSTKGTHRQIYQRFEEWYLDCTVDHSKSKYAERLEWMDTVVLQELPDEKEKREAKEAEEKKKEARSTATNTATAGAPTAGSTTGSATGSPTGTSTPANAVATGTPTTNTTDPPTDPTNKPSEEAPEVPAGGHEIIDLTIDDLARVEEAINNTQGTMVVYLTQDKVASKGPKKARQVSGKAIKFGKPQDGNWAKNKNWEFGQLQTLVITLSTVYGMNVPKSMGKEKKIEYAIKCAEALGFFEEGVCTTKAHMDAHINTWISPLHSPACFLTYMSTLYAWFGRDVFPNKGKAFDELKSNYKKAKSALANNRFTAYGSSVLGRHLETLVTIGDDVDEATTVEQEAAAALAALGGM